LAVHCAAPQGKATCPQIAIASGIGDWRRFTTVARYASGRRHRRDGHFGCVNILKRVFIVDDEFIITSTLALILRHHGFDATSFTQPLEALQAVKERAPDVLVSDIMMPEFSGIDLAIRVQQQCPECKILLFSGQAYTNALLEKAKTDGHHFEVLLKPVHPVELMRRIHEVLRDAPPPLVANEV
jgi:CheY-like chemotaxis protein